MNKKFMAKLVSVAFSLSLTSSLVENTYAATTTETTSVAAVISSNDISSGKSTTVGAVDTYIQLGNSIIVNGVGATVDSNKVTISSAGTYSISGTLADGQI